VRPFPDLLSYHEKLTEQLKEMESENRQPRSIDGLRHYLDFAERRLFPNLARIREATGTNTPGILFEDLWYLFKPGDLIFVPERSLLKLTRQDGPWETAVSRSGIWKVLVARLPMPETQVLPQHRGFLRHLDRDGGRGVAFRVVCYHLDFDGEGYGAVQHTFTILHYEGEKDIRELEIYPLRFAEDPSSLLQEAKATGELFTAAVLQKNMMCQGWTCSTEPIGTPDEVEGRPVDSEYIDGEVIVDLKGMNNCWDYHDVRLLTATTI